MIAAFLLTAFLAAVPADVIVVPLPARGVVTLPLLPAGRVDVERLATVSRVTITLDKVVPVQSRAAAMNAYVVWAVSPEGALDNLGELAVTGTKASLTATTTFDRLGILISVEPHYMVDRPNSLVAYTNQAPRNSGRPVSVSIQTGVYDYARLPFANPDPKTPNIALQARAALAIAAGAQADRLAEMEYRQARVALESMEDLLRRPLQPDLVLAAAHESIRRSQRAFVLSRDPR